MFARSLSQRSGLAARALFNSSRPINAVMPSFTKAQRSFSATPATNETADGPKAIIDKYGAVSFWGMLGAILVTKEIYVIDAETLLACQILSVAGTFYVLTGDSVNKWSEDEDKAVTKKFHEANDFMLDMFKNYKDTQVSIQDKPAVCADYLTEFKEAITENAAYKTVLPKHAARASVLAALESIANKEQAAASEAWKNTVSSIVANVETAFEAENPKLETEMLDLAVASLGFTKPSTSVENDPVKRMFVDEFNKANVN